MIPISYEMLTGKGSYMGANQKSKYYMLAYVQVSAVTKKTWNKLPSSKEQTEELSNIRRGSDELYQDFVSRLTQASNRLIGDSEAGQIIIKQLAFENANAICKVAIYLLRNSVMLQIISKFAQILANNTKNMALTAALQGKIINDVLSQQGDLAQGKNASYRNAWRLFSMWSYGTSGQTMS